MINLFEFAPNDQSLYYLTRIFGYVGTVFPVVSDSPPLLLSVMFKTFNSIILTVGVVIVIYVTVVGVMKTAGEGEFLGKQWNSLWVPIRIVLGIASLVPAPSGYSAIQIVMMWVIVQGIGAADTIWNTTLSYLYVAGSPFASPSMADAGTQDAMTKLFQGLVCSATARKTYPNPSGNTSNGAYFCALNDTGFCQNPIPYDLKNNSRCANSVCTFEMGPTVATRNGACGTLTYCDQAAVCQTDPTSLKCVACKAQTDALQSIVGVMGAVAERFADVDYQYRQFYATSARQIIPGAGTPADTRAS
ncbi:MAG: DotA/TraY family protein, partial [Gammaproteobacteria bacterium]|nr:DotA/TraY family protein [Gammaproteobacteria bacterium]